MSTQSASGLATAAQKMRSEGLPEPVVKNFERLFQDVMQGKTGVISEEEIEPVREVPTFAEIAECGDTVRAGMDLLHSLVVIRLNGGLGTTMGLERAKSLLKVKGELSFNDIIAQQLRKLGESVGISIPLVHMTSFSTDKDVQEAMHAYPDLSPGGLPITFLQHRHPKIYLDTMMPAAEESEELNWNPPGHGDIYAALLSDGLAERLLAMGKRYAFVANADNLGATVEPAILGFFVQSGAPFLMETAERTKADAKGGHLARRRSTGRLILRKSSQAPTGPGGDIIAEFQDITKYKHFNTNNIWLDLKAVVDVARSHDGTIPLPLISNKKNVNPRDRASRKVIQIETAMGAAIEVFEGARALQVPRRRFAPVKSNNDLLVVRSDVYTLSNDFSLVVSSERTEPGLPIVSLDAHYFGLLKDFEARMQSTPSLLHATSLAVQGDVVFGHPVAISGVVSISSPSGKACQIPKDLAVIANRELQLS
jgi:UTP--glucose-1-phosphate uridylyltransferase